jgi:hypothetical protein
MTSPYTYGVFVALYTAMLTFPGNFRFLSVRVVSVRIQWSVMPLTPSSCQLALL